jgi:hypothetical protein
MKPGGVLRQMLRRYAPQVRARGRVLKKFANRLGLVYFGTVDQHTDEHDVIRGLTVSRSHIDTHYAVGSYDGYDVSLVDRFDVIETQGRPQEHTWVILQVALRHGKNIPHFFLKPRGVSDAYYSRYFTAARQLQAVNELFNQQHSQEFHGRYELITQTAQAQYIEELLTPEVTHTIAARFWPHAAELFEGKLYVYITEHRLSETVLSATTESALWLAEAFDSRED